MTEIIKNPLVLQIIKSIMIYGFLYCLLAVLFERILIIKGVVRGNTVEVIISSILATSLFEFISFGKGNNFLFMLFIVFAIPLNFNRIDLAKTIEKGTWWWKSEQDSTKS